MSRKALKYLVGAHVSGAGGVYEAVGRSAEIKADSFAVFLRNQKQWKSQQYSPETITKFHSECVEYGVDPKTQILPHAIYLINLANPDPAKEQMSLDAFLDDLNRCEQLGIGLYNFHPGSTVGAIEAEKGIELIAKNINIGHSKTSFVKVVLENMAGSNNVIGSDLQQLREIIDLVEDKSRVGVCIDTCHGFSYGYDMTNEATFEEFWRTFDEIIGYRYLAGMHLNDSKYPYSSHRDVHQNIGLGFMGLEAFRLIMNKPELKGIPLILETPMESDADSKRSEEVELLKWLEGKSKDDPEVLALAAKLQDRGKAERNEIMAKLAKQKAKKPVKKRAPRRSFTESASKRARELLSASVKKEDTIKKEEADD